MSQRPLRTEALAVGTLAVVALFAQAAAFNCVRLDDAYITYRYAQNVATGTGFVFNPGEHLLGTTSPGHALIGALLYALVGKMAFPAVMDLLGCAGWTAQAVCAYALLRNALGRGGAAFVAIAIAAGATRAYFWLPLETNIVAALVLGAFALASRGSWVACGAVAGVAVLFRPDALLACVPLGVLALREQGARTWRPLASFVVAPGAWAVFAVAYFGTLLPHTFRAKAAHAGLAEYARHALFYPALSLAPWSRVITTLTAGSWATVVPVWVLAAAGAVILGRRSRALAGLAAYGALLSVAYVAMRPDTAFGWHLYPVVLLLAIFALSAVARWGERLHVGLAVPLACAALVGLSWECFCFERLEPVLLQFGPRDDRDRVVAAYLAAVAASTDYVAAEEVGTIAYLSELPMVDRPGLVSDGAAAELFAAIAGRPSRVRWAVLSPRDAEAQKRILAPFQRTVFGDGEFSLTVFDLRRRSSPGP